MYRFAIVGCGRIASRHAENILKSGTLTAVCDIIPEKADAFAGKYNAKAYYSIDDLLKNEKDLDVVTICSPNGFHAEHSIKSIQGGKHVLCEKPMCITSVAAWQMIDTSHFFRRKLFVVKQNRYNPAIRLLRESINEGHLGKLYSFTVNCYWNRPQGYYTGDWKGTKNYDGGILYTQFSHFIDLVYLLFGELATVRGFAGNFAKREHFHFEDTIAAVLEMQNGILGNLNCTINSYGQNTEGSITVFGEKGSIKVGGQYLNRLDWYHVEGKTQPDISSETLSNNYGFYEGSMSNHHIVYEELLKALQDNDNHMVEDIEAVKTIEMIEKIYKAI